MQKKLSGCLQKILISVILFIPISLIGAYVWTKSYIRSDEFGAIIQHELSKVAGGKVEAAPFAWDGWKLENENLSITAGKGFNSLEAKRVSVELDPSGLLQKVWRISDVHVRDLNVHVSDKLQENRAHAELSPPVKFDWKDITKAWLPRAVELNSVWFEQLNGSFGFQDVNGHWKNAEAKMVRSDEDFLYSLSRGEIVLSAYPEASWNIKALSGRLKSDRFFINEGEFFGPEGSRLTTTAEGEYKGESIFQGQLEDFPLSVILKEDWKRRVNGDLNAYYTMSTGTPGGQGIIIEGRSTVDNGVLTALPGLEVIIEKTGIQRFRLITLDTCEFDFLAEGKDAIIKNINIESDDFLKLEGRMEYQNNDVAGTFELGVSEKVIDKMPKGTKTVFSRNEGQHYWTTVNLTRTNDEWSEDLSKRMVSAIAGAYLSGVLEDPESALNGLKDYIDEKSGGALEDQSTDELIEKGKDLIDTGVKSLFDLLGK